MFGYILPALLRQVGLKVRLVADVVFLELSIFPNSMSFIFGSSIAMHSPTSCQKNISMSRRFFIEDHKSMLLGVQPLVLCGI